MSVPSVLSLLRGRLADLGRPGRHRGAARALLRIDPEPESWLDVGTYEGEFPARARELFPYTAFDGIDPTTRVGQARHAERVEEAYVGRLADPRIGAVLRERYDVVTMLRSADGAPPPDEEVRAALTVLRPGGLLLVETARTRSPALRTALEAQGCTVLAPRRPLRALLSPTTHLIARRAYSAA